jgi:hypothetical protein
LLFATATPQLGRGERTLTNVPQVWWFMLDQDGTSIVSAGRIADPATGSGPVEITSRRYPNIGVDQTGAIHLVYLARVPGGRPLKLVAQQIELDPRSREPRIAPGSRPVVLDSNSALIPPLVSADGRSVIGVSCGTGQLVRHRIDDRPDVRGRIALAEGEPNRNEHLQDVEQARNRGQFAEGGGRGGCAD